MPKETMGELVTQEMPVAQCHASTVAAIAGGVAVAFFGGSREGGEDVAIWFSRRRSDGWEDPRQIARGMVRDSRVPCWNPVLYQAPGGELLLFYKVGPSCDRWWGMLMRSADGGATWSAPERLPDGILGPIKNKPVMHAGELICPSSSEDHGWRVHLDSTPDHGKTWRSTGPLNDGKKIAAIQPSVLIWPGGEMQLLCRTRQGWLAECWSRDDGRTWSEMSLTSIPNPNSGTDAVVLHDGRGLLVYNPTDVPDGKWGGDRTPLCIAMSEDGRRWRRAMTLEDGPGEYSYPAVVKDERGVIHITYTYRRENVKYRRIAPNELLQGG